MNSSCRSIIVIVIFLCISLKNEVEAKKRELSENLRLNVDALPRRSQLRVKRATRRKCSEFAPCSCRSRRTVECTKVDCLQNLPTQTMSRREGDKITKITVTRQQRFTRISDTDLNKLPNLKDIRFFNNKISVVHENAFRGNRKIELLDLHRNNISVFPSAISQLSELRHLNLGRNKLASIPLAAFDYNPKLEQLILKRNNFVTVSSFYFPRGLIKLSLGMNRILSLPDIRYLKHLKVLRLESNGLRSLRTAALPESLVELRLCNNSISDMQSFDNLYNLRRLRLAGNTKIRNIRQSSLFRSQSALVELDLRDCSISGIDASAFACYPYLRTVELQGNQLREYNPMWFAFNQKIKRVSLSRNPWNCDCAFAQHLEDLAIVANNTRRIKSRAKRNYTFNSDFANVTCDQVSSALSRNGGSASMKLFSIDTSSCRRSAGRWQFELHKRRNNCPSRNTLKPTVRLTKAKIASTRRSTTTKYEPPSTTKPRATSSSTATTPARSINKIVTDTSRSPTTTTASTTTFPTTTTSTTITTTSTTASRTSSTTTTSTAESIDSSEDSTNQRVCARNGKCLWPFTYEGKVYDQTCADHETWSGYTWCYVDENENWQYCDPC